MKVTPPVSYGFCVALGGPAELGKSYDVDDETGAQLIAQGWSEPKAKPAKKAAAKKAAAKKAPKSEEVPAPEPEADAEADTKKETA